MGMLSSTQTREYPEKCPITGKNFLYGTE